METYSVTTRYSSTPALSLMTSNWLKYLLKLALKKIEQTLLKLNQAKAPAKPLKLWDSLKKGKSFSNIPTKSKVLRNLLVSLSKSTSDT